MEKNDIDTLIKTDVGLLTKENVQYLYDTGLINRDGNILYKLIRRSGFNRPMQIWNMFCLIKEDITEITGFTDLNLIVDVMREGLFEDDRRYPRVLDFIQKGSELVLNAIDKQKGGGKSRKYDFNFDDE
jgi:hypothetical protein